ncbi:MAG: hypothetical protein D6718_04155 [Acidobacteria bacterium]|nr:MAG: hypothetical protein D6718_04155 [Acidobacteriota bacterium]
MPGDPKDDALDVRCPLCRARLSVDRDTGEVLHASPDRAGKRDFDDVLGEVRRAGEKREKDFLRAFKVEKRRRELLEKKFERARQEAADDDGMPLNPLDLD